MLSFDDMPIAPDKVFVLANPDAMHTKLHWEISELEKALSTEPEHMGYMHAPAYHAFNCTVTAWHIADWIWEAADSELRNEMLAAFGKVSTSDNKKNFVKFQTAIMAKCRAIHICRQLATGSKHMVISQHSDPTVRAEMRWDVEPARAGIVRCGDPLAKYQYKLEITDNNIRRSAVEILQEAYKYWERFLEDWGFKEGSSYVTGKPVSNF